MRAERQCGVDYQTEVLKTGTPNETVLYDTSHVPFEFVVLERACRLNPVESRIKGRRLRISSDAVR